MKSKRSVMRTLIVGMLLAGAPNSGSAGNHFSVIQIARGLTGIGGLNDSGTTTGAYDSDGGDLGFLRTSDGTVTTFNVTGARNTIGICINSGGVIAGMFGGKTPWEPFIRNTDGTITTYNVVGTYDEATPTGINDKGTVVGWHDDDTDFNSHGFTITPHGKVTEFDIPGAASTEPYGINKDGYIVGTYWVPNGRPQGFVLAPDGTVTTVNEPNGLYTYATAINDNGVVAGWYVSTESHQLGFVEAADGTFTTVNCPDSGSACAVTGVNNAQQVIGWSSSADAVVGFVQSADGRTHIMQPRGAPAVSFNPAGINTNGLVAGSFLTQPRRRTKEYGFVWTP